MSRTRPAAPPAAAPAAATPAVQRWLDAFESSRTGRRGDPAWLDAIRRAALERFARQGFPTTRQEAWRYTNVTPLAGLSFHRQASIPAVETRDIDALVFGDWGAGRIVFVNGRHAPQLSRLPAGGPVVEPLAAAIARGDAAASEHLGRVAASADNPFTELNTALFDDGVLVRVPRGTVAGEPLHIVFVSTGAAPEATTPVASYPRCLVVAEPGGQLSLVESYIGLDAASGFTNAVTEIELQEGSVVKHTRLQRESPGVWHIGALHARVARGATFASHVVSLGGHLSRLDLHATLAGEGADVTLNGLYALSGRQHADHHTVVDHAAPHGTSRELYKGVLDEESRGVFDGTVIVRPGAQKTDSRQENRNLLLSPSALVDTKPTLMIHADDVKCSHAATIGQMDESSIFYLRTRAIDPVSARRLLIRAFVVDVLQRLDVPALRAGLEGMLFAVPEDLS